MNQYIRQAQYKKGFSQLILIVIIGAVIVAAGGSIWYYRQSAEQNKSAPGTQTVPESSSSGTSSAPIEQAKQNAVPKTSTNGRSSQYNYQQQPQKQSQATEVSKPAEKSVIQEPKKEVTKSQSGADPDSERVIIYVTSSGGHRVSSMRDMVGSHWSTIGTRGSMGGQFERPQKMYVDSSGRIYVAHSDNGSISRMDDITGRGWVSFAGFGIENVRQEMQPGPYEVTLDRQGRIYTAALETLFRMDDMSGTNFVKYSEQGSRTQNRPWHVAFDSRDRIYLVTEERSEIIRIDDMTGAGRTTYGSAGNGKNQFLSLSCIRIDALDRIWVCDDVNNRIVRIDAMDGTGWTAYDGSEAPGHHLVLPQDVALGPTGKVYIADTWNDRLIRIDNLKGDGWISFGTKGTSAFGEFLAPKGIFVWPIPTAP